MKSVLCLAALLLTISLATLDGVRADFTGHLLQALSFTECRRDCITRCERYASTVPGNMELCVGCLKDCIAVFAQQANAVKSEIAALDFSNLLGYERNELPTLGMRAPRALAARTPPSSSSSSKSMTSSSTTSSSSTSSSTTGRPAGRRRGASRPPRAAAGNTLLSTGWNASEISNVNVNSNVRNGGKPETPRENGRKKTSKSGKTPKRNLSTF